MSLVFQLSCNALDFLSFKVVKEPSDDGGTILKTKADGVKSMLVATVGVNECIIDVLFWTFLQGLVESSPFKLDRQVLESHH